jgi:NAD(P)H dehydrogenase (quinone)
MKKAVIVVHSVCGNGYLVARKFHDELKGLGMSVSLLAVADPLWVEKPDLSVKARENLHVLKTLPLAKAQDLVDADLIIFGAPTYFGNVSAQMKAFMDSTGALWIKAALAGKKFAAFTSCGNTEGGGDLCLQAMHTYAKYMGMLSVPLPVTALPADNVNALGVIHYSNGKYGELLDTRIACMIVNFCQQLLRVTA